MTSWNQKCRQHIFAIMAGCLVALAIVASIWSMSICITLELAQYGEIESTLPTVTTLSPGSDIPEDASNNKTNDVDTELVLADPDDSFSACLLWMDDNHLLEEWLAYHYFVLKLRYVVLTIDGKSRTSPQAIIDRWNSQQQSLNMTIVTINETHYVEDYSGWKDKIRNAENNNDDKKRRFHEIKYHRRRQKEFYRACSEHLVEKKRGWTSYHDIDEFVSFEWQDGKENKTETEQEKLKQPGYILRRLNVIRDQDVSCLQLHRIRYCSKEMRQAEIDSVTSLYVPEGFANRSGVVKRLGTLRFKYATQGYEAPKSFIDLRHGGPRQYVDRTYPGFVEGKQNWQIHAPMTYLCQNESVNKQNSGFVKAERLVINHYLGSWESYSFREDARKGNVKNYETWRERANMTIGEYSNVVRPWLSGFAELVGTDTAAYLLQDAGRFPEGYDASNRIESYQFNSNSSKAGIRETTKIRGGRGSRFVELFGKDESENE